MGTLDMTILNTMSTADLEQLLVQDLEAAEADALPTEVVCQITDVLREREISAGTYQQADVQKSWDSFKKQYLQPEGQEQALLSFPSNPSRPRRSFAFRRKVIAVAAAVILLFAATLTAHAYGADIWGAIAKWGAETFHFEHVSPPSSEISAKPEKFLDAEGLALLAPTYCPEGFELYEEKYADLDTTRTLSRFYMHEGETYLSIQIQQCLDPIDLAALTFEKNDDTVDVYMKDDMPFYIMSNMGTLTGTWSDGTLIIVVSGNVSLDVITDLIDSISFGG